MSGKFVNVLDMPVHNLMDVPASLRRLADMMESGEAAPCDHAIVVVQSPEGNLSVHGYGTVGDRAREVGVLHMAAMFMATAE